MLCIVTLRFCTFFYCYFCKYVNKTVNSYMFVFENLIFIQLEIKFQLEFKTVLCQLKRDSFQFISNN